MAWSAVRHSAAYCYTAWSYTARPIPYMRPTWRGHATYKRPMSVSNRVWRNRRNRIWRNHYLLMRPIVTYIPRGVVSRTPHPLATRVVLLRCGLLPGGAMTYLATPPALDRPHCNLTSRQSLQLSECGLLPLTRRRACHTHTHTHTHTRLSLELYIVIFHPAR